MTHKFKAGQNVMLVPGGYDSKRQTHFQIVRPLPAERGILQYRIKSILDGHERVVVESELA